MTKKQLLRREMSERQAQLSMLDCAIRSSRICTQLIGSAQYRSAKRVMCYFSTDTEVKTAALIHEMTRSGREVYLPRMRAHGQMDAVRFEGLKRMAPNSHRIWEPMGSEILPVQAFDLVLVPGVAFDELGGRLGHGGGYYDRWLAGRCCPLIALAYEAQMVDRVPTDRHDMPVDKVITEDGIYDCAAKRKELGVEESW